jgi:acyl-homoserine lactone synthase
MTHIHVITKDNKSLYEDKIQQYYSLRHEIFFKERGWKELERLDGLEIDSYDNEHAIYLLAIDQDRVVGGQRLYPTILPDMISEVFAHMAGRGIPQATDIFE